MNDFPEKVEIKPFESAGWSVAGSIDRQSLIKWLKNEIDIAETYRQDALNEIAKLDNKVCDRYKCINNALSTSEGQIMGYNHLLIELGEKFYKGKRV